MPESTVVEGINKLHRSIFGTTDNLSDKLARKPHILIITAMDGNRVIGYKIGYEIDRETFYSWLGGVDTHYRENGIAATLMDKQHAYLREKGYKIVRTKTMNKWRNMLILNIKFGFDVIETYTDEKGLHKIILEKKMI
ncbi:N-acetyltransferase [Robertmurraya yapensis]|uniref:N-acetyltransferase n=1 Tax=Bacillus yapensis TaxID=2492960 RepID=A0A3S0IAV1_9BACI|nr:N-acetyltransferase [Bacillus yapensis]TKS94566.1 GNAT family N-acetyltransferase [Bacillus yapensis]